MSLPVFVVLAALMAGAAIAVVAWPFLKARRAEGKGAMGMVALLAVAIPLAAFLLYGAWSNFSWDPAAQEAQSETHSMQAAIVQLEERLARETGDVEGWLLLGRSYLVQNDFPNAARAYEKAYKLTGGKNAEATVNYAEALALVDPEALNGQAGQLFEEALSVDPQNPKALWYGGLRALRAADAATARDRWAALSATNPPPEVKTILDQRIAELDARLGQAVAASDRKPAATAAQGKPGTAVVRVSIAPQFAGKVPAGTPLFVLARDPTQPGPPLAAQRLVDPKLPVEVALTDADAMAAGRTISTAKQLTIVARYSKSGMPMATTGDLFGEARIDLSTWAPAEIVIDRAVP